MINMFEARSSIFWLLVLKEALGRRKLWSSGSFGIETERGELQEGEFFLFLDKGNTL